MRSIVIVVALLGGMASTALADFHPGRMYICDFAGNRVFEFEPTTGLRRVFLDGGDGLDGPSAIQIGHDGRLLVANFHSNEVIAFDRSGVAEVVLDATDGLDGPGGGTGICLDRNGHVYVANRTAEQILRFDADYENGTVFADTSAGIASPDGIWFDANGNLCVANVGCTGVVTQLDPGGTPSLFDHLFLEEPQSVAVRGNGDLYLLTEVGVLYRYIGGSSSNRVVLGTYGSAESKASIQFSRDFSVLYHVHGVDGLVRQIDPESGAESVLLDLGANTVALAVVGSHQPLGGIEAFGEGQPGTGGVEPSLAAEGASLLSQDFTIQARGFVGGAQSFLLGGGLRTAKPFLGIRLYIDLSGPFRIQPFQLGGSPGVPGVGEIDIVQQVPLVPSLLGLRWYYQHLALDPGAATGLSTTNGLGILIGR